jgi:hypothetical protein
MFAGEKDIALAHTLVAGDCFVLACFEVGVRALHVRVQMRQALRRQAVPGRAESGEDRLGLLQEALRVEPHAV